MNRETRERMARINKTRRCDSIVGVNGGKKRSDDRFKRAYAEFKRPPYGLEGAKHD